MCALTLYLSIGMDIIKNNKITKEMTAKILNAFFLFDMAAPLLALLGAFSIMLFNLVTFYKTCDMKKLAI